MNTSARFVCILFAAAVTLPSIASAQDQPGGRRYVALTAACPDVLNELPENLYPAWRELDAAAQVLVEFKLDANKVSDVRMSGGHGAYIGPVRRAVKALKCRLPGAEAVAVRFSISFTYPEDQAAAPTAMQFFDQAPALASLPRSASNAH